MNNLNLVKLLISLSLITYSNSIKPKNTHNKQEIIETKITSIIKGIVELVQNNSHEKIKYLNTSYYTFNLHKCKSFNLKLPDMIEYNDYGKNGLSLGDSINLIFPNLKQGPTTITYQIHSKSQNNKYRILTYINRFKEIDYSKNTRSKLERGFPVRDYFLNDTSYILNILKKCKNN